MSAVKMAKEHGLKNFMQLIELSGYPRQTLKDMHDKHPIRYETVLLGAKAKLNKQEFIEILKDAE